MLCNKLSYYGVFPVQSGAGDVSKAITLKGFKAPASAVEKPPAAERRSRSRADGRDSVSRLF